MDEALLSRIEDAGINASAAPQQLWLDGWLVRFNPGKAKRARCINAVAPGRLPIDEKLRLAAVVYADAKLPMVVRITPFSQPAGLDAHLAGAGFGHLDDTRVMVLPALTDTPATRPLPPDTECVPLPPADFAQAVGALRGTPADQREAHAKRLGESPVHYQGLVIRRRADQAVLACGQFAREGELVGLYDITTAPLSRNQGLARWLCEHMLSESRRRGAQVAYLQVEAENAPARHVYSRLGFRDAYAYHYRTAP